MSQIQGRDDGFYSQGKPIELAGIDKRRTDLLGKPGLGKHKVPYPELKKIAVQLKIDLAPGYIG